MGRAVIDGERRAPLSVRRRTPGPEERVPFTPEATFEELTARALRIADLVPEPYAGVFALLEGCGPAVSAHVKRSEKRGASWRQLCAIAHRSGFTFEQRQEWYRVAAGVPLSDAHARHVLEHLSGRT